LDGGHSPYQRQELPVFWTTDLFCRSMVAIRSQRPYPNAGKPWVASDVLFLEIAALQGMSLTRIAGFLGREEDEVRNKTKELEALRGETESPE
jgi:hypothetical protein